MLLPIIWAAAFLFSVLNMHYPALASAPGAFLLGGPVSTLLAGGRRTAVLVLYGSAKSRQKKNENFASSGVLAKDNSF